MDLFKRRQQFIKNNFKKVFNGLDLTDNVLKVLTDCEPSNPLRDSMDVLAELGNYDLEMFRQMDKEQLLEELVKSKRDVQKCFTISQFTQSRHPVDYLSELLKNNQQASVAGDLQEYNRSEPPWPYQLNKCLKVNTTTNTQIGSQAYKLIGKNKGLCYIFLNEEKFENQADLYRCVFREMDIIVCPQYYKSCEQIKSILTNAANNREYQDYLSFIAIFVGHGADGLYAECRTPSMREHVLKISEILDIYAENKIGPDGNPINFQIKPKVFIFDSCRTRSEVIAQFHINELAKREWIDSVNRSISTFVLQPCAEGQVALYSNPDNKPHNGLYSHFGLPFCYTIAQYACDDNLSKLMNRTLQRMKVDFELRKLKYINCEDDVIQLPQETKHANAWNLFFNPGC